jgi:hypothetical protein
MPTVRENHAALLAQAADRLSVLDNKSPLPDQLIEQALSNMTTVFEESAAAGSHYIKPDLKRSLHMSIVSMRGLLNLAKNDEDFTNEDLAVIRNAASQMRHVAANILIDPRTPKTPQSEERQAFSPLGLRMKSLTELAGAKPFVLAASDMHATKKIVAAAEEDTPEVPQALLNASKLQSRMKTKVPPGHPYVEDHLPILAVPKEGINESALSRAGVEYTRIRGFSLPRQGPLRAVSDSGYLLLPNQLVYGIPSDRLTQELIDKLVATVSKRMGSHTNPLTVNSKEQTVKSQTIYSPGKTSPLSWVWLVPSRWVSSKAINVSSADFPWLGSEMPHLRKERDDEARKELQNIEQLETNLKRIKKSLPQKDFDRKAELIKQLGEPKGPTPETMEQRTERLARQRKELDDRVAKRFAKQLAEIKAIQDSLTDFGIPSDEERKKLKAEGKPYVMDAKAKKIYAVAQKKIATIQAEIDKGRDAIRKSMIQR